MNRPLRLAECSQPISWVVCVYFVGERCIIATRQQCCCNAFRMHSRNVRNVFVICVLHIRCVKVWFLRCKSMVFGVQKGGFYIAKVWFLFFECCVVAICLECYHNPSATKWQSVRNVLAIRQQPQGSDLSCPHIRKHPRNGERKYVCGDLNIRILKCGNVYLLKWIHVFDNARTRAR